MHLKHKINDNDWRMKNDKEKRLKDGMNSELDSVVNLIISADANTPQLLLKSWLDEFYAKSADFGLSSPHLIRIINFVCHSSTLSMTTRLYIVDNCLLPHGFLSRDVLHVVMNQLGTATAISEFKIQTPKKIQVALCKWLVHVYFLLMPEDQSPSSHLESSVWIHLWQYDFLQHWLTYILVWSTTSPEEVKRWKVTILERVGSKPNYEDSRTCATLVLLRFENIVGSSRMISSVIKRLKCNARKLSTLQNFEYDGKYLRSLRSLLLRRSPSVFTEKILDELVFSSLNQIRLMKHSKSHFRYLLNLTNEGKGLQNIESLHELAWSWNTITVPKNVEIFLCNPRHYSHHFYLKTLSREDDFWISAYQWICLSLNRAFNIEEVDSDGAFSIVTNVIKICQIHDLLVPEIITDFLSLKYLKASPRIFSSLFVAVLPLQVNSDEALASLESKVQELLAYSFLWGQDSKTSFPTVVRAMILMIKRWLNSESRLLTHIALKILQDTQELLMSTIGNAVENRFTSIELIASLEVMPTAHLTLCGEKDLKYLISPPRTIHRILIADDPLLLNACCHYLISTKRYLVGKEPTNKYVQRQNDYILDLTNYLWRNKLLDSKRFLSIPSRFIRAVIDNAYLPSVDLKAKTLFSITGIPALSYASVAKLWELERASRSQLHYSGLINEEGFKEFKKIKPSSQIWIYHNPSNLHDLKVELLKAFSSEGPYRDVSNFLFTYLKSLSKYQKDDETHNIYM